MRHLLIYIFLFLSAFGFSNQKADINCLSVEANGDVTISWTSIDDDCSSFTSYEIYSASSYLGSYSLIQSISNISTSNYINIGAGANNNSIYYYIKTISACGSFCSDTLNTIFLEVTNPGNSSAQLDWNSLDTFPSTNQTVDYYIFRNINSSGYNLIDSVNSNTFSYNEDIYTCGEFISYKIGLNSISGCISFSNNDSSFFTDNKNPEPVFIDTVSVFLSSGKTILSWSKSPSPDVEGYWIYMETDPSVTFWTTLDTIYGANNTTFINNNSSASGHSEFYKVAPFDSCQNRGIISEYHGTIYAFPYFDDCLASVRLEWSHYKGWTDSVAQYKVYCKVDNNPEIFLGAVSGNVRQYIHSDIVGNSIYCYYVRAFNSTGTETSTSNLTCISPQTSSNPSILNADYATVDSYNSVKLSFTIDAESEIKFLKLLRSENIDGPYEQIAKLNKTSTNLSYIDYVDIMKDVYFYKTVANNKCDIDIKESNVANNIVLNVKNTSNLKHELSWNKYEKWAGDVSYYNIYRIIDDGPAVFIYQQFYGIYTYIDDLSEFDLEGLSGKFCYYVEAVEGDFNPYGIKGKSKSNIACAEQFPRVFIANAFTPNYDGINDVIIPYVLFASPLDYIFTIYNRWGEVIFSTNKPLVGWDGNNTVNGKKCSVGTYVYHIKFTSAENQTIEQSGNITLYNP